MGKDFNVAKSVYSQIPFFACRNIVLNKECQSDIAKYMYCDKFKVSPYHGSFSEQPLRWIKKSFIIRAALNSRTSGSTEKNKENKHG